MKFLQANRIAPDGTPHSAASHLGLYCLPMSHKKVRELIEKIIVLVIQMFGYFTDKGVANLKLPHIFYG